MEVLHDLRPQRRLVNARTAAIATLLVLAAMSGASACGGGGDRQDSTADTAVTGIGTATATDTTHRDGGTGTGDTTAHADSGAVPDTATILIVADDSAAGDVLYHNSRGRCITCHGPRGTGNASLGPSLRDSSWVDTDPSVRGIARVIRDGVAQPKGGSARMPAFRSQLDSAAIHQIAVYVYSLAQPGSVARDSAAARAALPTATPFDSVTQPNQDLPR